MTIARVATTPVRIPIEGALYEAAGAGTKLEWGRLSRRSPKRPTPILEYVLVRIETDDGAVGIGEAPVDIGFFGETLEGVRAAVDDYLGPQLFGADPLDRAPLLHRIDYRGNGCAKSGIDLALHDLVGRALGVPVSALLGGSHRVRVPVAIEIAGGPPEDMAEACAAYVRRGARAFKPKIGGCPDRDAERLVAIREAVGHGVVIRADANQGYSPKEAIRLCRLADRAGVSLELLEQPVAASDLEGMAFVRREVETLIEADESCYTARDALRIIRGEAMRDSDAIDLGEVDLEQGWQSVVAGFSSEVENSNADHSARQAPRHRKATDPLVLEAVTNDGAEQGIGTQWTFIRNVREGSWLRFAQVPLGEGYRRLRVIYGNAGDAASRLEVHLDAADGPLVAEADLPPTDISRGGSVQVYGQAACEVSPEATGARDVFLVFRAPGAGPVGEFEYFRFERYRGALPLQPDEVRLELRVGAPDGDIIGVLYPRPTGGTDRVAAFVASLEPTAGRQRLYLVVRSAVEGPIGRLRWVRLERADPGATPVGPGDPQVNDGRMVMPQATHLPRARPNDRYPHAVSTIRPRARLGGSLAELAAQGPPTDGLLVWLDAADGGALERDDRGSVALWRERSGSGRDATQPDPELRPTYLADGLNGRPAVLFDGDRETRLELPDLSADKLTATILAVFSNPAPPSEVNHDQRILTASDGEGFDYIVGIAATVPGLETGGPRLGAWVFPDRWGRHVRIGCFSPNYQTYFTGSVSEVLVWTRALSELEQDRAIAYLVAKWDLRD